jgi:hypothetical protein
MVADAMIAWWALERNSAAATSEFMPPHNDVLSSCAGMRSSQST